MMQLLALVYVTSNFIALLVVSFTKTIPGVKDTLIVWGLGEPGTVIVGTQLLLLLVYVPLTLRSAHGFRALAGCAAGLFGSVFAALVALLLMGARTC